MSGRGNRCKLLPRRLGPIAEPPNFEIWDSQWFFLVLVSRTNVRTNTSIPDGVYKESKKINTPLDNSIMLLSCGFMYKVFTAK